MPIISKRLFYEHHLNPLNVFRTDVALLCLGMRLMIWSPPPENQDPLTPEYRGARQLLDSVDMSPTLTVTDAGDILQGTNRLAFGQVLSQPSPHAVASTTAYLNDVAMAHVLSLNSSIPGNQSFVISSKGLYGTTWGDAMDIIQEHYPQEVIKAAGFKLDAGRKPTARVLIDSTYSQKNLGFEFKSYKEQVLSVSHHYLELLKLKGVYE